MKTILYFTSAVFFILALISYADKYLNKEVRKMNILRKIKAGIPVPYNKDIEEMVECGVLDENLKPKF